VGKEHFFGGEGGGRCPSTPPWLRAWFCQ